MIETFRHFHPVAQALVGGLFTWLVTALGSALIFFIKSMNKKLLDGMLGFAAGVMIAASFWSLLAPAIEMSNGHPLLASLGFFAGALCLSAIDKVLPHLHPGLPISKAEGIHTHWHRSVLLVLAITLHNIPEGLSIGVAFGALAANVPEATFGAAFALALGIGLQNFPEGFAVSGPLRHCGLSRAQAFFYGQLSGVVEPIAAVAGAAAVLLFQPLLPFALSFAAGAMIFVVIEELIPESQRSGDTDLATLATIGGFTLMMVLDVMMG